MTEIENQLKSIAEKIVGNVGVSTKTRLSVTNEEYDEFVYLAESLEDIKDVWEEWIKSYLVFAYCKARGVYPPSNNTQCLYWRSPPEVKVDGGKVVCYARLLITTLTEETKPNRL